MCILTAKGGQQKGKFIKVFSIKFQAWDFMVGVMVMMVGVSVFLGLFFLVWLGRQKQGTASDVDSMQMFVNTKARVAIKFHHEKLSRWKTDNEHFKILNEKAQPNRKLKVPSCALSGDICAVLQWQEWAGKNSPYGARTPPRSLSLSQDATWSQGEGVQVVLRRQGRQG